MNSYELLPSAVDRKTLLKCESSVPRSRPKGGTPRRLDFPSPISIQARAPERCQLSLAQNLYLGLETSEGLSL